MSTSVSLYNPRDTDPEQLAKMLIGRTPLLEEILEDLRGQAKGRTRQHWLLRGQRGMGKTHLTGVIHYRVRTDPELQKVYLPLWLGEADVYEVYSAATLLVKVAERLAEQTRDDGVLQRMHALEGVGDEEEFFEAMLELLSGEAERRERTLLVLMENLDALLGSFAKNERMAQTRQLRSVLLHNPRFLFVSTTPTRYLRSLSDPKEPLYGHLKERDLSALTEPEVGELFERLVELTGRRELEKDLEGEDGPLRLRVIHQLTGGLPRSVIMAFTVMQGGAGLGPLVEGLRKFLDAQTAYFEARLSQLSPRERAIVTTMALARENLTMKEIAQRSRLPERTLSTHMQRLENDGHVRPVSGSGGKGSPYELSEGLFRLWYQFRRGQVVLEPLVAFIATWFRAEEIETLVHQQRTRVNEVSPAQRRTAEMALLQVEEALSRAKSEEGRRQREMLWESARHALSSTGSVDEELPEAVERKVLSFFKSGSPEEGMQRFMEFWEGQRGANKSLLRKILLRIIAASAGRAENTPERELEIIQLITNRFESDSDPTLQDVWPKARLAEALALGQTKQHSSGLERIEIFLNWLKTLDHPGDSSAHALPTLMKIAFLWDLNKRKESLRLLESFLHSQLPDEKTEHDIAILIGSGKPFWSIWTKLHTRTGTQALQLYVDRFTKLNEPRVRAFVAMARFALIAKSLVEAPEDEEVEAAIGSVASWLEEYRLDEGAIMQDLRVIARWARGVWLMESGDLHLAREDFDFTVQHAASEGRDGGFSFQLMQDRIPALMATMGPEQVLTWLDALARHGLDQSSRHQLELHQQVAKLLLSSPGALSAAKRTRQQQMDLLRVPPEYRKTLEITVRQVLKLKKKFGAEW